MSEGFGGSPVKSNDRRRIRVRLAASGAGVSFFASSAARMNRSIGLRTQPESAGETAGGETFRSGWKLQCRARASKSAFDRAPGILEGAGDAADEGAATPQGTPLATHSVKVAISSGGSFDFGGIW